MKNIEKYYDRLIELADAGGIAVRNGKPVSCYGPDNCEHCQFDKVQTECLAELIKWLNEEYVKPEVDWSKVEKGTKVLVADDDDDIWDKAYFFRYRDDVDSEYLFAVTAHSEADEWSNIGEYISVYKYCKLAEDEDE